MNDTRTPVPLCIDCDGTLLRTDILHEMVFRLLKVAPWRVLWLPFWLAQGKAQLKHRLQALAPLDVSSLPTHEEVVALAREARAAGRPVVLATASPQATAQALAQHLGTFDEVLGSDERRNLAAYEKRAALVERYGERGFDYVGNSTADLPVWGAARRAVVVSSRRRLATHAAAVCDVERVIETPRASVLDILRGLRMHQWLKNLLVFVPLVAGHRLTDDGALMQAVLAFVAFGCCASAVYVLNDLVDLESDRRHIRKRRRPFAAGLIPLWQGALAVPLLLAASASMAIWLLPWLFGAVLAIYFASTLLYSLWLKRQVIVDVLILAGLYTLRVIAGGAATAVVPSFWLLAFSMFIFLSLAMVKRYSEMLVTLQQHGRSAAGRGYTVQDLPVLMSIGCSSGLLAVLVFALYINSPETHLAYKHPQVLWLVPPLLLYWVCRIWMKAHRDEVDDDPVVFAIRDWQSIAVTALCGGAFTLAT
jgi:4-hydroxybenzoate polyprenyltransferase/phosphoserine phosphatase